MQIVYREGPQPKADWPQHSAAATNGSQSRPQMARGSPSVEQVSGLGQMAAGINADIGSLASGNQLDLEKRGPVNSIMRLAMLTRSR